jgi:release factor glutamine methyltransferase
LKAPEAGGRSKPRPFAITALKDSIKRFKKAGVPQAETEAEVIFKEILGLDTVRVFRENPTLTARQIQRLKKTLLRREKREPLQYIIGHVEFLGHKILVGPGVLIPRPETELVTLHAIKRLSHLGVGPVPRTGRFPLKILELCTGSGAIAIALAKEFPRASITAVDISAKALAYAKKNKTLNKIKNISLLKGNLFEPLKRKGFDLIIANPPYIKDSHIPTLEPEVRDWEPREALAGGPEGLDIIEKIISEAPRHLVPGGLLVLEVAGGTSQQALNKMAKKAGLSPELVQRDYAGLTRIFTARKPPGNQLAPKTHVNRSI